jgi:hypothetical protein
MTIGMLALVLVWKSTSLVHSFIISGQPAALIAAAWASGPDTQPPLHAPANNRPRNRSQRGNPANPGQGGEKKSGGTVSPNLEEQAAGSGHGTTRRMARELCCWNCGNGGRSSMRAKRHWRPRIDARRGRNETIGTGRRAANDCKQKLESLDASHQQQEDNAWQGLVKVYETMKPRDAAAIFNDLGMPVLLAVVGRMKEAKAAAILAAMTPDKARDVTTQLALFRTKAAEPAWNPAINPPPRQPGKAPGSGT